MMTQIYHKPVLLQELIDSLEIKKNGVYVDLTFGGGGHSREILKRLGEVGKLIAFDNDEDAARNIVDDSRFTFLRQNFIYLMQNLNFLKIGKVDGIIADLGVSSHQFDNKKRGFSFDSDYNLDMRMNKNNTLDAMKVINTYNHENLSKILFEYGDIKNSKKISEEIIKARTLNKINTTFDLNKILMPLYPERYLNKNLSRIYQAIRIEVNKELDVLKSFLEQTSELLLPGGRLCVISYHSLEDRMVKRYITNGNFSTTAEKDLYGNFSVPFKKIGKMIQPSAVELKENIRSRSAKLRIAEKI